MLALFRRLDTLFLAPAWGPAMAAAIGCALPLVLGVFSGHPGFYWATVGAFAASLADPRQRLGMHAMLTLTLAGAASTALGFWAAGNPFSSLLVFAAFGLLLAIAQHLGRELAKLMFALSICLCLGLGQYGRGTFDNPAAVATLFLLGALGVTLLGFGLRGVHGLRMWPELPSTPVLRRLIRQQRRAEDRRVYWLFMATDAIAFALAGLAAILLAFPQSQWLTMSALLLLGLTQQSAWPRLILHAGLLVLGAAALMFAGFSLVGTPLMVMLVLSVVALFRLLQGRPLGLFLLQTGLGFLLLSESLSHGWDEPQWRLVNAAIGAAIGLLAAGIALVGSHLLKRRLPVDKTPALD